MKAWFEGRSLREKRLLVAMAALAVLTLIWLLLIRPLGDALSAARERHAEAVVRLGETASAVAAIRTGARAAPPLTGTLADTVRQQAASAGFTIDTLDEEDASRIRVGIAGARPAALVPWLARLEAAGVLVDSATLTDKGDRTVGVQLVLKARAR